LLGLARASYHHQLVPEPDKNPQLMLVIDETDRAARVDPMVALRAE
jgi:hypothetical protein